jgi:hypothetical protein
LYIRNQEKHHEKCSFINEYVQFLEAFDIQYDRRYIFSEVE